MHAMIAWLRYGLLSIGLFVQTNEGYNGNWSIEKREDYVFIKREYQSTL